jgi:hypothetical protein
MKICQNKAHRLVFVVGLMAALAGASVTPVLAQTTTIITNEGPVNLLGVSTADNTSNGNASGASVTTIDDAFNAVNDDTATGNAIDQAPQKAEPSTAFPTQNMRTQTTVAVTENGSTTDADKNTNQAEQSVVIEETSITIGLREVEDVGLAAIGVRQSDDSAGSLNELIWRGTAASRATFLYENGSLAPQSRAISSLAIEVVAREAVPPAGANRVAHALVRARLGWLAAAGRSDDLAVMVGRLPNDDDWLDWKKWLVEYQLMQRLDRDACAVVDSYITTTLDPYWHKLKVICSSVQDDASSARFGADILAASGVEDPVFFALVDEMLSGTEAQAFDPALVEALHVVLMDAAHHEISLDSLAALPPQMAQGTVALRYLGTDARLVSTFDGLTRGLITPQEAGNLWRSAATAPELAESALARHNSGPSPLTTAMTWRAIADDTSAGRVLLIAPAMKTDIAAGNGQTMLPLYAELASEALTFPGLDAVISADDSQSFDAVAMLIAMQQPESNLLAESGFSTTEVAATNALMQMLAGGEWNHRALADLDLWTLLPVIEALGIATGEQEWLDFLVVSDNRDANYKPLSPLLLRALNAAAEKRRVAETVLLASWALDDIPLHHINPQDVAVIVTAMNEIGQTRTGRLFATEVVKAHLLSRFSQMIPTMSEMSLSAPQDQTALATGDGMEAGNETALDETMQAQNDTAEVTSSTGENSGVETVVDSVTQQTTQQATQQE